ncbi:hypothetical protein BDY24DRAFT_437477 [Mrakia frigida]|uniref:uncharacterized protein n=1 Tax=Mrakia frigida TaxID=29902 RepID=UPI003FCC2205
MFFPLTLLLSLLVLTSLSAALPFSPPTVESQSVVSSPHLLLLGCPSMKIRCVKDSIWPSGIVGDIGTKEFVWIAPRCQQADAPGNTIECNETFEECEGRCEAYAPIPF